MNLLFRCLLLVALCGSFAAQAQTKLPPRGRVQPKPRMGAGNPGAAVKDGLTMKTGRIVLTELGVTNPLTVDKKLVNGATITTTGLVTSSTGITTQMLEGDMVSLTGRVTSHTSMVEGDSLLKIKQFDLKYPGKRKKMEEERVEKAKVKAKRDEEKAKMQKEKENDKAKAKRK